ncbi:MAG: Trk system potassium transporter TrkA [Bacteroidetes bacterium]|nr:Trk system potassium transporter TrkA [Rhodothermia bacterium]MCS7155429.1 Trk system potassium transporter TrkA [Bacteroidota bacterium]MCX7907478.1 Trk system potassium transporter TrkA [Bacteroidota bacterium]MDW8138472.1 Trk system potassium transporter TrkA [Bacteroidota bacterium]MDW8284591.1 Trk system potassium transporter TrkA [Bacteroidota bacterium]
MKIVVLGAGAVGFDIARMLSIEGHEVTVLDKNEAALSRLRDQLDVLALQGNATSARDLKEAGVHQADILIAVTSIDEVNIVACMLGWKLGARARIARVRNDELTRPGALIHPQDLGIDRVIHPEESAAQEIGLLLQRAAATDVLNLADGQMQLVGIRLDAQCPVLNIPLRELANQHTELLFRIVAIVRGQRTIIPGGGDILRRNDQIFVVAPTEQMPAIIRLLGKENVRIRTIMILGGGSVALKTAEWLVQKGGYTIKLIEPDRDRAVELAAELPDVLVIHGDGTDIDLLVSEGIADVDAFLAVSPDEENNLVTCLMAKHLGVPKTVALVSKPNYVPLSQTIGLDAAVNEKIAAANEVLRYVRGAHVLSVTTIPGLAAEILELEVSPRSRLRGRLLRDVSFPRGSIIGGLQRARSAVVATGQTRLEAGDRLIVFALPEALDELRRLVG